MNWVESLKPTAEAISVTDVAGEIGFNVLRSRWRRSIEPHALQN
jgi:hypothetical protein